jgi:hypothetical protein
MLAGEQCTGEHTVPQGLKPRSSFAGRVARLKPCPFKAHVKPYPFKARGRVKVGDLFIVPLCGSILFGVG